MNIGFHREMNGVNPIGIAMMIAALIIVLSAGRIARHIKKETEPGMMVNFIKLGGMILCMAGAMIAILC